jgi:NTP pyrophosphatase (non-canonical NTP hydrolase)
MNLETLRDRIRQFTRERNWAQFHTPKNLSMGLSVEAAELLECFLWLTPEESTALDDTRRAAVEDELADVLVYLVMLADRLDIDLLEVAARKLEKNARKYPVDRARGNAAKYTDL